jgi:hypothetical protein
MPNDTSYVDDVSIVTSAPPPKDKINSLAGCGQCGDCTRFRTEHGNIHTLFDANPEDSAKDNDALYCRQARLCVLTAIAGASDTPNADNAQSAHFGHPPCNDRSSHKGV